MAWPMTDESSDDALDSSAELLDDLCSVPEQSVSAAATESHTYFVTFTCYGTWLHGDVRGSVDREHNQWQTPLLEPDEVRERDEFLRLRHSPVFLGVPQRRAVAKGLREVARRRSWRMHAFNVRTSHVHVVVRANRPGKRILVDLKSYATRQLRLQKRLPKSCLEIKCTRRPRVWTRGGSARLVTSENSFRRAIQYTLNEQGMNVFGTYFDGLDTD